MCEHRRENRSHPECKQQPGDKIGLDVRSFLIRPVPLRPKRNFRPRALVLKRLFEFQRTVQRVPRYRLLLQDLLNCTEAGAKRVVPTPALKFPCSRKPSHYAETKKRRIPHAQPMCYASQVEEVARHINEEKREHEQFEA
eukprot:4451394-Pleurochrysis_carterae.AAC.2